MKIKYPILMINMKQAKYYSIKLGILIQEINGWKFLHYSMRYQLNKQMEIFLMRNSLGKKKSYLFPIYSVCFLHLFV